MADCYSALGSIFERLNADCDYDSWSQYLLSNLSRYGAGQKGIDIGCGNGTFTRALCKAGYDVSGLDISPEMLTKARELASHEGIRTEFLCGDITKLKVTSRVDFAVSVNDCLNYVSPLKLKTAFSHVAGALKKGGLFLFDVSSEDKLKHTLGNNLFAEDRDEVTYLWFNRLEGDRVEMDLTFFFPQKDGSYRRFDEHHTQYAHSRQLLEQTLRDVGFELLCVEGHLGGPIRERINFICKKV